MRDQTLPSDLRELLSIVRTTASELILCSSVREAIDRDVDTLAVKAGIAQAEGDLPRAAALLAPLHPNADEPNPLGTQIYQATLERHPVQIIPRLKEILAKPDPALGYINGDLRFWLGWAQQVAWRSCRRPGKLATGSPRTGSLPQRTT